MTSSNASADPVLQVLLEEYRIMWEESRSLKRNALAAGGLLVGVIGTALTVAMQDNGTTNQIGTFLLFSIPYLIFLGLFTLIWFFHFVNIVDSRLSILENQINEESSSNFLVYQSELGRRLWSGVCLDFKDIPGVIWRGHGLNSLYIGAGTFIVLMTESLVYTIWRLCQSTIPCWLMAVHLILIALFTILLAILICQEIRLRSRLIPFMQSLA